MFSKVLVANRGEIACRVMRTLRRMGIASVAVYTDADAGSLHVSAADEAVTIGSGAVAESYLDASVILDVARACGAAAIHPGYGFLSENAAFAARVEVAGVAWIGPRPEHLERFGQKHTARALASELEVPLLAGSGLLATVDEAIAAAGAIGYPVMLKATAGGGGIGMMRCDDTSALESAFATVSRLADSHFGGGGLFVERFVARARHIEVQLFGTTDGVVVLGERDCSAQRRNQKVIEETPPVGISPKLLEAMRCYAHRLGTAVGYRSAGTVEFVVDMDRGDAAFLEVNTRLQVEHGVTELVTGIDLVEWMVLEAAGELTDLPERAAQARLVEPGGAAFEARIYAEDPAHGDRPGTGTLVDVAFPADARVDTWVAAGTEVTPWYDPLLAKVLVRAPSRSAAVSALRSALAAVRLAGVATNLDLLRDAIGDARFASGGYVTTFLSDVAHHPATIEVIAGGMQTTVQDLPGRLGLWAIGVPPSGPMDETALRSANALVGNDKGAAGLEISFTGPTLRFETDTVIALTGAAMDADIDGAPVPWWTAVEVAAGAILRIGALTGAGCRAYLAVAGGFDTPAYLGSRSTFLLGGFGGHAGRALIAGDVLPLGRPLGSPLSRVDMPTYTSAWEIGVLDGPHGAPDFFTPAGIDAFFAATWEVHHHSDRTGVRLVGPPPEWARADGGEAGLHPSNIHDTVYAVGTVDFTGDMPVVLGPDGPSLGGFVCPVTVASSERWKLGQLTAGDTVRFVRMGAPSSPIFAHVPPVGDRPDVTYRRAGDRCVLVEYGPNVLDLALRFRVHALMDALTKEPLGGVEELAPGIRSLQVRYEPLTISGAELVASLQAVEATIPDPSSSVVPSRIVHLPLSWDDPATRVAIERYMQVVRDDAPWCPWNIEFIRRINGLQSVDDVRRIVFDASYVVLGLGDVYLGAPVATPLDPRHRLVTTKYNPARTWTPENAVGIGGAYLCVYGMEGPGGYQFVGRTIQMWNRYRETHEFQGSQRWLLRFFDQLRFYPVSAEELLELRRDFALGRHEVEITETSLSLAAYQQFLVDNDSSITAFKSHQQAAFDAERTRWEASGELTRGFGAQVMDTPMLEVDVPPGSTGVSTPVHGAVSRVVPVGTVVSAGETVVVIEAMKTETAVATPTAGVVSEVRCEVGQVVGPGPPLVVVAPT